MRAAIEEEELGAGSEILSGSEISLGEMVEQLAEGEWGPRKERVEEN